MGRLVAARLGLPFVDADAVLESRVRHVDPSRLRGTRRARLPRPGTETLADLTAGTGAVLATGGGAVVARRAIEGPA